MQSDCRRSRAKTRVGNKRYLDVPNEGYVVIKRNGKRWLLHRWIVTQIDGPIPPDKVVMHTCDTPDCFLYAHLRVVDQADNVADMHAKGRGQTSPRGIAWHKDPVLAEEIRERYRQGGISYIALGEIYGCSAMTIGRVINYRKDEPSKKNQSS